MVEHVRFDGEDVRVLTLVYAFVDGRVLTLERAATKKFLPGWFVAPGGKVEAGEDIVESGAREFFEETGMRVTGLRVRGSYTYFNTDEGNRCGVIYLLVGDGVEGEFQSDVEDGTLRWLTVEELMASERVMHDHKAWIGRIFTSNGHFACVGSWHARNRNVVGDGKVEWADSDGYFLSRGAG